MKHMQVLKTISRLMGPAKLSKSSAFGLAGKALCESHSADRFDSALSQRSFWSAKQAITWPVPNSEDTHNTADKGAGKNSERAGAPAASEKKTSEKKAGEEKNHDADGYDWEEDYFWASHLRSSQDTARAARSRHRLQSNPYENIRHEAADEANGESFPTCEDWDDDDGGD